MELRRYRKNHRLKPEIVESSVFVAFWAEDKAVFGLDAEGVEWMLCSEFTLRVLESGDKGLTRTHRSSLVRVEAVDRTMQRPNPTNRHHEAYCVIFGREFSISRACKNTFFFRYHAHVSEHGFATAAAA
jgi:hypothetical protein